MRLTKPSYSAALLLLFTGICSAQDKLSLNQAIEMAMNQNPRILAGQKEIDAANARILQAEAIPDLEFGISWGETPSNFDIGDAGERSIGFVQPLTFPGKRKANSNLAQADSRILEESLNRTRSLISAEVKRAYLQVWLNQKLVTNLEDILELLRQFQETAMTRYQAQKVPYLEVLRAKTERAKMSNDVISARRDAQNSSAELNSLLGWPGSRPLELADGFSYQPFEKSLPDVVNEIMQKSAAHRLVELSVERSQAQMRLAQKSYLPDFSIGLFNQSLKEQPPFNANQFFGTNVSGNWEIDVGLSIPFWFWKRPKGEVLEAKASIGIAQLQFETYNRISGTVIENAYRGVKAAEEQVQIYESSLLRDVEDALRTGIVHYQMDQIDALNLMDLYRTFTVAKAEYFRALYNFHVALTDLQVAGEIITQP